VSASNLLLLNVSDKKILKPLSVIDIGTKAKSLFIISPLEMDENEKRFRGECLKCYQLTVEQLKIKLPLNSFLESCGYINPIKRNCAQALERITSLTRKVTKSLANVLADVFPKQDLTCDDVCDTIRTMGALSNRGCS
jgi:hypothetical protein